MRPIVVLLVVLGGCLAAVGDKVSVTDFKAGILAKDQQPSGSNLQSVAVFSKSARVLEADSGQRLYVTFNLQKDGTKSVPQQVFVSLEHVETGEDVVFVVDPQTTGAYVLDVNLKASVKAFNNLSGKFKVSLIVGGTSIKSPINWHFADATFDLPVSPNMIPKSQELNYKSLPEIRHQFREPEKRPSAVISDAFTLICLAPLAVLIIAWLSIGINFGNAPVSVWVPIFHVGLGGIFALYFVFWIQLDMFETLKYLAVLGGVTFIAGNRVFRAIADQRKSKTA